MRNSKNICRDMDGEELRAGDSAICLALPPKQPCKTRVMKILNDDTIIVDNGRNVWDVPSTSCILYARAGVC